LALAVAGASGDRAEGDASRVFRADPGASLASVFAAFAARSCFPGDALPIRGAFALTMLVFGAKKLDIARMPCASLESRFGGAIANGDTAPGARHPRQPQRAFELKPRHRPAVFETPFALDVGNSSRALCDVSRGFRKYRDCLRGARAKKRR
jgi:hypothetical protein